VLNFKLDGQDSRMIMPGRKGHGCGVVAVGVDTSGSITPKEISAYMAEVGAILADVRPQGVVLFECDAAVQRVSEANTLDELEVIMARGVSGGGGTAFTPVFDEINKRGLKPEALIYCTDMYGSFPDTPPNYPVIWAATTDVRAPFGDVVRLKV
jgi:predicted metal-dependent peptidase